MGLYTKAAKELHDQALEVASSAVSAALAGTPDYGSRMLPFLGDYIEMGKFFTAKCPVTKEELPESQQLERQEIAGVLLSLLRSQPIPFIMTLKNGTKVKGGLYYQSILDRIARKLKGKLLFTRSILQDNDKKPKCMDPKNHKQPCFCKMVSLAKLANAEKEDIGVPDEIVKQLSLKPVEFDATGQNLS